MAYATLSDLKNRLRIPAVDTNQDTWLNNLLDAATTIIEQLSGGRRFAVDTAETRLIDYGPEFVMGGRILRLPYEMHTITQVVNGDGIEVTADEYVTLPRLRSVSGNTVTAPTSTDLTARPFYEIQLKSQSSKVWTYTDDWEGAISVTGKFGYSETPPSPIELATLDLATHFYKVPEAIGKVIVSPDGMLLTPSAVPDHVVGLVRPFTRWV